MNKNNVSEYGYPYSRWAFLVDLFGHSMAELSPKLTDFGINENHNKNQSSQPENTPRIGTPNPQNPPRDLSDSVLDSIALELSDIKRLFCEFAEEASLTRADRTSAIRTFRRIIHMGLESLRMQERSVSFETAVRASMHARRHRRPSTLADLRSYTNRMLAIPNIRDRLLRNFTGEECQEILNTYFNRSPHVFRKAGTVLHSIFTFGIRKGWCQLNPVKSLELPPVHEERITPLNSSQIRTLLRAARADDLKVMLPSMWLLLWCGVRPGEVRRLRWGDIDKREKCVYIEAHASKTGGPRAVPLRGQAKLLLEQNYPPTRLIAPRNWNRLWKRLRARAGIKSWQRDVLRHTFATFHLKRFHNLPQLQEEMGHRDCNLLRTRYINLRHVSSFTARRFFS